MFGLLFVLLGIVLPIAALFHAQNGHPHSLFGPWVYVVVWLWAAMYVIPSLGKNVCRRLFSALQVSAFILILLHYCQRRSFLKRHNRLDTCSEEMGLCFTTWFCEPCSYGQMGATSEIEEVWSLKVLKVICSKLNHCEHVLLLGSETSIIQVKVNPLYIIKVARIYSSDQNIFVVAPLQLKTN